MLAAASLGLLALPLSAVVMVVALRISRGVLPLFEQAGPRAPVWRLHEPATAPATTEEELPSLPEDFRYDAISPGPLQLVDEPSPSTKCCPDCAETVLASARVCKHCRYRFEPPLSGSWAIA
jgi:hypothetical protein